MKGFKQLLFVALFVPLFIACSTSDDTEDEIRLEDLEEVTEEDLIQAFAERESSCPELKGYAGGYWDFVNDIAVPFPQLPEILTEGVNFVHDSLVVAYNLPQGYVAIQTEYPGFGQEIGGAEVYNANSSVMFLYIPPTFIPGQFINSSDFMAGNRFLLLERFGLTGDPDIICSELNQRVTLGFPQEINTEIIEFNNITAQVWTQTSYLDEGTTFVVTISVAPSGEYEQITQELFLPLSYQLDMEDLFTKIDKDGDGFSVLADPDDNNANVPAN